MIDKIDKWTNKIIFNNYEDFETYPCAEIKCPNCKNSINIKMEDLNRHKESNFSNLTKEDNEFLTRIIIDSVPNFTNSFLDYYCPNCRAATRIMYDYWAGGKNGEFGYVLKYIANNKNN